MSTRDAGSFLDLLERVRHANSSHLCVGLDPEPAALPTGLYGADGVATFCLAVVESTKDLVCAYKPNVAFFERLGAPGWEALGRVVAAIPSHIPIIADAKRGDIGNTSKAYAEALFDVLGAHACTLSPYLGVEALAPFLERDGAFSFILCRTSNPGSGALQDLDVGGEPLYARVLRLFSPWIAGRRAGLVIGAQEAAAFTWAARLVPEATVLVPGIGAQGGTVEALAMALTPAQAARVVVSVSRAIIHAGRGEDYAVAARRAAIGYRDALRAALATAGSKRAAV
jgi:orotidine-5'-phosphate decarboxylase